MKKIVTGSLLALAAAGVVVTLVSQRAVAQQAPAAPQAQGPAGQAQGAPQGRAGQGRGRGGRGGNRPPSGPASRLPDNPFYGVNAGKPDLGGKGMWNVPYIVDMQRQGKAPGGGTVEVPFTAEAKKI